MELNFYNKSDQHVVLSVDSNEIIYLKPKGNITVCIGQTNIIKIVIRQDSISYVVKKRCKVPDYCLIIETSYFIKDISEDKTFVITREKIRFSVNALYDRCFLDVPQTDLYNITYRVIGENKMKRMFNISRRNEIFFNDPFEYAPGMIILLFIIDIILSILFGWKYFVALLIISWLLVALITWLGRIFFGIIFNNLIGIKTDKKEFYSYFENEYIAIYYSKGDRKPVMGEIEY